MRAARHRGSWAGASVWGAGVREGSRRADAGRADGCGPGCRPRQGGRGGRSLPVDPLLPSGQLLLLSRPLGPSCGRSCTPCPLSAPGSLAAPTLVSFLRWFSDPRKHWETAWLCPNPVCCCSWGPPSAPMTFGGSLLSGSLAGSPDVPAPQHASSSHTPPIIPRAPRPPPPARPWGAPAQRLAPRGLPPRCLGHTCPAGRRADRARARPGRQRGRSCDSRRVGVSAGRAGDGAPHRAVGELRHLVSSAPQHPLH